MQTKQIYDLMNQNPVFFLATLDDERPTVRGMLLYHADETGIVFHTGTMKDVYRQIQKNPNAELCFLDQATGTQVRVFGVLEFANDRVLKEEIVSHPSRAFLRTWKDDGAMQDFYETFAVLRLKNGRAKIWTMQTNFDPPQEILLE